VSLRVVGYDKIMGTGDFDAVSISQALNMFSAENGIDMTLLKSPTDGRYISSLGGLENGRFGGNDGWMAYVLRGNTILTDSNLFNEGLRKGDKITVFYGEKSKTRILKSFTSDVSGSNITFFAGAQDDTWTESGGKWVMDKSIRPVAGIRVNLLLPNGNYKILKTDTLGRAQSAIYQTGVYAYNAEGYVQGAVPIITPSEKEYLLYGIGDSLAVTRGEAAAFLVNTFGLKQKSGVHAVFNDVPAGAENYAEIMTASSNGIISGRSKGIFVPDDKVKAFELCVMLSNILDNSVENTITYKNIPDWAQNSVNAVVNEGLLDRTTDWASYITSDTLLEIYGKLNG
jgi:hypothetical protein